MPVIGRKFWTNADGGQVILRTRAGNRLLRLAEIGEGGVDARDESSDAHVQREIHKLSKQVRAKFMILCRLFERRSCLHPHAMAAHHNGIDCNQSRRLHSCKLQIFTGGTCKKQELAALVDPVFAEYSLKFMEFEAGTLSAKDCRQ